MNRKVNTDVVKDQYQEVSAGVLECAELSGLLQRHLPAARVECIRLPTEPALKLYLLNQDFHQQGLTDEEMSAVLNYPAYWAFCWASGQVLAQYLRERPAWVRGKRVLDFGSGSGVAGIAAALAGAAEVVACDIDPDARQATRINAELNGVHIDVRNQFASCGGRFDLILVADVLYDRENLSWLDQFLERAAAVLVADSRIRDFEHPGYRKVGRWQSTTLPDLDESPEFRQVSLYLGGGPAVPGKTDSS